MERWVLAFKVAPMPGSRLRMNLGDSLAGHALGLHLVALKPPRRAAEMLPHLPVRGALPVSVTLRVYRAGNG